MHGMYVKNYVNFRYFMFNNNNSNNNNNNNNNNSIIIIIIIIIIIWKNVVRSTTDELTFPVSALCQ